MSEHPQEAASTAVEVRSRELFERSVDTLDLRVVSRLNRARHAALDAAAMANRRPWLFRMRIWTPAAGVTAAALLGAALWLGTPAAHRSGLGIDGAAGLEDLDIVTASDEGSGDALEMLQNDLDFYDFAVKDANSEPAA